MFPSSTYRRRRHALIEADRPESGLALLLGNEQSAMNYRGNPYPFRQDSTFLYYFGLDLPGLAGLVDLDDGSTQLYGDDPSLDEVVWMGDRPSIQEYAERAGVTATASRSVLHDDLTRAIEQGRPVHFLPPYRTRQYRRIEQLLGLSVDRIDRYASSPLVRTVVQQRSHKSAEEVEELDAAVEITAQMHRHAMEAALPGTKEREIAGALTGIAEAQGRGLSFRPTCSVHGEVLHNHVYANQLSEGDLLLVDAGAASPHHYAGDITRVSPVGGTFSSRQRALYEAVLDVQTTAIEAIEPGVPFREIHLRACRVLTSHLMDLGLMQGDVEEAVAAGAHALFFPHGLGHMLGLDTHEMENLGEDVVGYAPDQSRSEQFGLHTLRLARPLEPGFAVTVEPGCYFIPQLIRQWKSEGRHEAFIDYDAVATFVDVGGIRIEDDVIVTDDGHRVLGPGIPKTVDAVEEVAASANQLSD
jgi:Xaa-Pro aminopeptidase